MKLQKTHREALLVKLQEVNDKIELDKSISVSWSHAKEEDKPKDHVVDWHDIDLFILQEQKKVIEKSLIDNDIDF